MGNDVHNSLQWLYKKQARGIYKEMFSLLLLIMKILIMSHLSLNGENDKGYII